MVLPMRMAWSTWVVVVVFVAMVVVGRNRLVMVGWMAELLGRDYCMVHIYLVVQVTWVTVAWNGVVSVEMRIGIGTVDDMDQMSSEHIVVRTDTTELQQLEWNFGVVLRLYCLRPQFVQALTLLSLLLRNCTFCSMLRTSDLNVWLWIGISVLN